MSALVRCVILIQDNKSTIALTQGSGNHKRSKHFTIEFDALRESVKRREVEVRYIETEYMPADMLTKTLPRVAFQRHRNFLMEPLRDL